MKVDAEMTPRKSLTRINLLKRCLKFYSAAELLHVSHRKHLILRQSTTLPCCTLLSK